MMRQIGIEKERFGLSTGTLSEQGWSDSVASSGAGNKETDKMAMEVHR